MVLRNQDLGVQFAHCYRNINPSKSSQQNMLSDMCMYIHTQENIYTHTSLSTIHLENQMSHWYFYLQFQFDTPAFLLAFLCTIFVPSFSISKKPGSIPQYIYLSAQPLHLALAFQTFRLYLWLYLFWHTDHIDQVPLTLTPALLST